MLDLKTLKVISINKNKDIYHVIYMRNIDGKQEMELLKNGEKTSESIKPFLINYGNFLNCKIDNSKTTYQIFDSLYKVIYK